MAEQQRSRQSVAGLIALSSALVVAGIASMVFDLLGYLSGTTLGVGVGGLVYGFLVRRRHGGLPDIEREASKVKRAARPALAIGVVVAVALTVIKVASS